MLRCYLRWQDVVPVELRGHIVAVIDVLRWSTVVTTACANGAAWIEACATPEDALARAEQLGRGSVLLGGERGTRALPGFDLGNSPDEYARGRVAGRGVVTTTTNGTQALLAAREARRSVIAAFTNLPAVLDLLRVNVLAGVPVAVIAAGQGGDPVGEDSACAGAVLEVLLRAHHEPKAHAADRAHDRAHDRLNQATRDAAHRAIDAWVTSGRDARVAIDASSHAATLRAAGLGADVHAAMQVGCHDNVPNVVEGTWPPRVAPR